MCSVVVHYLQLYKYTSITMLLVHVEIVPAVVTIHAGFGTRVADDTTCAHCLPARHHPCATVVSVSVAFECFPRLLSSSLNITTLADCIGRNGSSVGGDGKPRVLVGYMYTMSLTGLVLASHCRRWAEASVGNMNKGAWCTNKYRIATAN